MNTNDTTVKRKGICHGECIIFESKIPAEGIEEKNEGEFVIVANSETTGNHHVIDMAPDVKFFTHEGKRFMKNSSPATVRCVMADRHDALAIPAGEWEVGIAQEFDYFTKAKRNVAD
jgi:hypothetical protein